MTKPAADTERTAVYEAEIAAFDATDLEKVVEVDEVLAVIRSVVASEWWAGPDVEARRARTDAFSSSARCTGGPTTTIRIATSQATWATAAHELAHALAGVTVGHGPSYRRAMLDVTQVITNTAIGDRRGLLHVDQLRAAYAAAGLEVGERDWPEPTVGLPFAL